MGETTGISWTDHTFNPWWGCTRVSPGCDHCYAEEFDARLERRTGGTPHWGKGVPRRELSDNYWKEPLKWDRNAIKNYGRRARVFCASMADVMDDEAPAGARERLWRLIDSTPNLDWQLLTKRPHRYEHYLPKQLVHNNVWLGTTAENQEFYDVRWPILLNAANRRSAIAWISYEPALGPLTMSRFRELPDWIIFGGESGKDDERRPCDPSWARHLKEECAIMGVKYFVKQMGARTPDLGKNLIPIDLQIQQFPQEG